MQSWWYQTTNTPLRCSLGATKPQAHPEDAVLVLANHQHTLKMQSWCYQTISITWRCSLGATKPPAQPEDVVLVLPNNRHTLKMQSWCYQTTSTPWRCSLVATKPPAHPEDGDVVSSRNVGKPSHSDAAVCQKKIHGKAPHSFETTRTTHPTTQLHKLEAL